MKPTGFVPRHGRIVLVVAPLVLVSCAPTLRPLARPAPDGLPLTSPLRTSSLGDADAWIRHHLMFGHADSARTMFAGTERPPFGDRLLNTLQEAIVLREAGEFSRSNELLEWAELETERRTAPSLTQTVGSLVINDRVVGYRPTPGELAMIPYYRMVNFLSLADAEGAAVEARRVSSLLAETDRGAARNCRQDGMLRYLAGMVFESAGEKNDALVSLRQAEASFESCGPLGALMVPPGFGADLRRLAASLGIDEVAEAARDRYLSAGSEPDPDAGELLILIERGFVAHLVEETIHIPLYEEDIEDLDSGDSDGAFAAAARVVARLARDYGETHRWGDGWDDHAQRRFAHALDDAYVLRLAWPRHRRTFPPELNLRVVVDADSSEVHLAGDLSSIVPAELDERRMGVLTRMVARGILKYVATRELERKTEKQGGELLGFVAGRLANFAVNELERADTRSWTLLPDQISMARLTLPSGSHRVVLRATTRDGIAVGALDLGEVDIHAGAVTVLSRRFWSDDDFTNGAPTPPGEGW